MSDIWGTEEWKERAAKFVEGECCVWCGTTEKLVPHHPKKKGGYTREEYLNVEKYCRTKEGKKFVLCKKCNFMENKGYRLCPVCKKKYYKPKRGREPMCWGCFTKTPFGAKVKEYYDQHPEELKKKRRRKRVSQKNRGETK